MSTTPGRFLIQPPAVQDLARRFIDAYGYHDAEAIPTLVVFQMLVEIVKHEHNWNVNLAKTLDALNVLSFPAPVLRSDDFFKETP